MANTSEITDLSEKRLSVVQLEAKVQKNPHDTQLKIELAQAIFLRYVYGENELPPGNKADLAYLREIANQLSPDDAPFFRAYLAYLDHKEKQAVNWLLKWAAHTEQKAQIAPVLTSEELFLALIVPFNNTSKGFWRKLAEGLNQIWPESAAVLTLHGHGKWIQEDSPEQAVDYFVRALEVDEDYWLAAWECAEIYMDEQNWHAAYGYCQRTLKSEDAQELPEIHFDIAWCAGKLRNYQEEEKHYRVCLDLDPNYPYARNNLGWSLLKQARYKEALEIFEESIKQGNDGKYPLYNRARTLAKLGRFSEAIEAWRKSAKNGRISRWVQSEISRLQKRMAEQEQGQSIDESELIDETEDEALNTVVDAVEKKTRAKKGTVSVKQRPTSMEREQLLEAMIEQRILQGEKVFDRRLRMYQSSDWRYGRQYAIPEVGRIDLLAEDTNTGDLVVIELKKDQGSPLVIDQITHYMQEVRKKLRRKDQKVVGIICAHNPSSQLLHTASSIPDLEVFEYTLTFEKRA